jgi:5-enolpyruvylshikimate-3-phosphate synthase
MNLLVKPSAEMSGKIELPPSKFYTQFGVAVSILADGKSVIEHPLNVEDTSVMLRAAEALGALVKKTPERWSIWGVGGEVKPN